MDSRLSLIKQLIDVTYLQDEQLKIMLTSFEAQANVLGKQMKSDSELSDAIDFLKSDAFAKNHQDLFAQISDEQLTQLVEFFSSDLMKKYNNIAKNFTKIYEDMKYIVYV